MKRFAVLGVIAAAITSPAFAAGQGDIVGPVRHVHDGDTFWVGRDKVRLWGIDAPELEQTCRDGDGDGYRCGIDAREALKALVGCKIVECRRRGRHGDRVVAECSVQGRDIGGALVAAGQALDATRYSGGAYVGAQRRAEGERAGVWRGEFQELWRWRKGK